MRKGILNRKQYNKIRKMDHNQMQDFFNQTFNAGYAAGLDAASSEQKVPDLIGLDEKIREIRGIGVEKAKVICETVKLFLEKQNSV